MHKLFIRTIFGQVYGELLHHVVCDMFAKQSFALAQGQICGEPTEIKNI